MPTKLRYYLVRLVNLESRKFFEKELSELQIDMIELSSKLKGDYIQILNKQLIKVKDLRTGKTFTIKSNNK